jgi:hypothetical protein
MNNMNRTETNQNNTQDRRQTLPNESNPTTNTTEATDKQPKKATDNFSQEHLKLLDDGHTYASQMKTLNIKYFLSRNLLNTKGTQ